MLQAVRVSGVAAYAWLLVVSTSCSSAKDPPTSRPSTPSAGSGGATAGNAGRAANAGTSGPRILDAGPRTDDDDAGTPRGTLVITPGAGELRVEAVAPKPVAFSARLGDGSQSAIALQWRSDRRELGSIDPATGVFTPTGAAGRVKVTAHAGSLISTVTIDIVVRTTQEGDPDSGTVPAGAGGLGGVGGEGGGTRITELPLRDALDAVAENDPELQWLYPYDGTVWPRGLPAPLLQWKHGAHPPVAVKVRIEVAPSFTAEVYLGPPTALAAGAAIDRIPIPQAIWRSALLSGTQMKVSLTAAARAANGGYATYKAPQTLTWTIAPTDLKGVVYYNSYGTKLAENFGGAQGGNGRFGGATLAIARDAFDPRLVAGTTTPDDSGCRVCHVVNGNGSILIVQRPNYTSASTYDLLDMYRETQLPTTDDQKYGWAGLSVDGAIALGSSGPPGSGTSNASSRSHTSLYRVSDGSELTARNFASFATQAAMPGFSPTTSKVAFNLWSGPGNADIRADGHSLVVMDVARIDDTTYDFTNPRAVFTSDVSGQLPGWPFFLPDESGVVFQLELAGGYGGGEHFGTRAGARGELWWTDLEGHAHPLDRANGTGYLPSGPLGHDADVTLQYEPTVPPIVAGGYAWVVFTSRRLYGNVATREPFESDPRNADISIGNSQGPTTKKLWVTAISLPAAPNTDPSHPAFYLPAQELYAGNSRGFWALDACKEDNASCSAGDECCGGFCQVDPEFGVGTCSDVPPNTCSKEYDKCNVSTDCCRDGPDLYCIAGRCATSALE
ncbi:MAG: hypothetical protein ABW321_17060 [Polyangiales bacterium]